MADKKIGELNALQDRLYKRLQAVESRIRALEGPGAVVTPRGDPLLDKNSRIQKAAWELEDAIFDQSLPKDREAKYKQQETQYPKELKKARDHHVQLLNANKWYNKAIIGLVLLTFLEVPPWCHAKGGKDMSHWEFKSGEEWCPKKGAMLSGVAYLPPGYAFIAEILIEAVILYKFWNEYTLERDHFWPIGESIRKNLTNFGFIFAIGSIIDTAFFLVFRNPFRLTFIFRTGLIFLLPGVQHIFKKIFNRVVMTEFGSVAVFFLGTMVFFAWIGFTVFQNANQLSYMEGEEKVKANKGFDTFPSSINTMFVGGVTGEFIDSFLPSFNAVRLSGAVWMIYLLLTQVLFKNLVMDTLIAAYLKGKEKEDRETIESQVNGMTSAFDLLADENGETIEKEDFLKFVVSLRTSPRWKPMPDQAAELFYDEFGELNKENFISMCCLLQSEFWITPTYSSCAPESQQLTDASDDPAVVNSLFNVWSPGEDENGDAIPSNFDAFMNKILLLNLVMVLVESSYDLYDIPEPPILDLIEIIFSIAYVGEVTVKLRIKSWGEYTANPANSFDFGTTILLCITSSLKYLPFEGLRGDLARYANILRLLRLIRILKQLKQFKNVQFMISVISRIILCAGEVLQLMGTFFFFFCNLALNLFGGLLYEGNEALEESEYAEKHWYVLNFNDMFMAFLTWFVQVLCEYVPNYSDALTRTATARGLFYGPYAGVIVLLFYITTAAIMYELLLAFTVDVFMDVKKEQGNKKDAEVEEEEEEEEVEDEDIKEANEEEGGSDSSSSSSESESEFDAEEFVKDMQADLFTPIDQVLHFNIKIDAEFQEELDEKYEKIIEQYEKKSKGAEEPEEGFEPQITKAAWIFENGVCHHPVVNHYAHERKEALEEEKCKIAEKEKEGEEGDSVRKKEIKEEIETINKLMEKFPDDIEQARLDHIEVQKATKWFYKAIAVLIILTLTEVPAWCHGSKADHLTAFSIAPGTAWCQPPTSGGNMYLSGIWYMPPAMALAVELIVEFIILRRFWLEYSFEHQHFQTLGSATQKFTYSNLDNVKVGVICAIGSIIDTAIFAIWAEPYRATFIFRTGLLSLLPGFQRLRIRIFNPRMIGQFASVAVFFIGTVLFFAWIFVTIYKDMTTVAFHAKEEAVMTNKGFEGLKASIYTTFLAGMTEGFSDIFIPTITSCRAAAILWIVFLLLTQVLFLNLVIDAFVVSYLESSEEQLEVQAQAEAKALFHCSKLLFPGEEMEKDVFLRFIAAISESPRMRPISPPLAEAIFEQFKEKEEGITRKNFGDVCSLVARNPMWLAPKNSFVENTFPGIWNSAWFEQVKASVLPEKAGEDSFFDWVMDWVLVFNMFFIVIQSLPAKDSQYFMPPKFLHLSTFFTLIYVFEVFVKLSVKSGKTYWSDNSNKFDFYTTWLLFGAWSLRFVHIRELQQDLMRYANILRLLRLLRVAKKLKKNKEVKFMVSTVIKMLEGATDILTLLGVTLYFFTTIGVNFFGGLLYEGNPKLKHSDYDEKHWYVFNFNDCLMGYTTWFTQLLCEYAPEWADALNRVAMYGDFVWYIYPTFYVLGVAIVFEILKAFTIETYLALKEMHDEDEMKKKKRREKELEQKRSVYLPKRINGVTVLELEGHEWKLTNEELKAESSTLAYRATKNLEDKMTETKRGPKWGGCFKGVDEGDGWIRTEISQAGKAEKEPEGEKGTLGTILEFFFPKEEEEDEDEGEEEEEDEEALLTVFQNEDKYISAVTALLKKDKLSLHTKRALLPKLQVSIKKAYMEALEEKEKEDKQES